MLRYGKNNFISFLHMELDYVHKHEEDDIFRRKF